MRRFVTNSPAKTCLFQLRHTYTSKTGFHNRQTGMAEAGQPLNLAPEVSNPIAPKLSASEFKTYNRMAEGMDYYVFSSHALQDGTEIVDCK